MKRCKTTALRILYMNGGAFPVEITNVNARKSEGTMQVPVKAQCRFVAKHTLPGVAEKSSVSWSVWGACIGTLYLQRATLWNPWSISALFSLRRLRYLETSVAKENMSADVQAKTRLFAGKIRNTYSTNPE